MPRLAASAAVLEVYQLRTNKENLLKEFEKPHGDRSESPLVNRKIMLREAQFDRLDAEAEDLGISRAEYLRSILQFYWEEPEYLLIQAALNDIDSKLDQLETYIRPESDDEYREAGRLLRGIRNHVERIEEGVTDAGN